MEKKKIKIEINKDLFLDKDKSTKVFEKIREEIKDGDSSIDSGEVREREID